MKNHCLAACFLSVASINVVLPFVECAQHENCHVHFDEPVPKTFQVSNLGTITSSGISPSTVTGTVDSIS